MKVVVTRQNSDGTYDEVGMNNKCLISHLKAKYAIDRHARAFGRGSRVRLEYYSDNEFYSEKPRKTYYLD